MAPEIELVVSAAASLTDAFREIGKAFKLKNPEITVRFNFGASGTLLQQIRAGAPVDVFASASPLEMQTLKQQNGIKGAPVLFASNRLVLIAPIGSKIAYWDDLKGAAVRRVALSNPKFVPSGRYAQQTLTKRGLWSLLQSKLILGENVRQTLAYVAEGNVDAGLVFVTDARQEAKRVRVVAVAVAGRDHEPILYPAAVTAQASQPQVGNRFLLFLKSREAQKMLAHYGFRPQ